MSSSSSVVRARVQQDRGPPELKDGALRVAGRDVPLYSGAMHYWRLSPGAWLEGLQSLKAMGFTMVETYVPWSVHATEPGVYDFGERDARKDLRRFLELAEEVGLWVFLRPGPHINAEMTLFGVPEWVVYDPECQARSPKNASVILPFPPQMFPVPSYASRKFLELTKGWYAAVGQVVRECIYPKGRVVMFQVDNEAAYYFRNATYDQDYHPDAVALWQRWAQRRYGDVRSVSEAHRMRYVDWEDVKPPRRFDAESPPEISRHLDWAEFREDMIAASLREMADAMAEAGMGRVPLVHNVPLGDGGAPISVAGIEEEVDVVGFDYYHPAREHHTIKRRTLYLAGTSRLPYAPEMGSGAPPWFTPLDQEDSLYCATAALAYGLRGFNLYMAVDRDRWCGAPVDSLGVSRGDAAAWAKLVEALKRVRFHQLTRRADVGLVFPRDYARLSRVTHLFGVLSPSNLEAVGATPVSGCREDDLGFSLPIQTTWWRILAAMAEALTAADIPFVYVDSEAGQERFEQRKIIVAPTFDFIGDRYWTALSDGAARGSEVVIGPLTPELDACFFPTPRQIPNGMKRLDLLDEEARRLLVARLANIEGVKSQFRVSAPGIELTVHEDRRGPRVVFLLNPSLEAVETTVHMPSCFALHDLIVGEAYPSAEEHTLTLPPRTVRVLELKRPVNPAKRDLKPRPPSARRKKGT